MSITKVGSSYNFIYNTKTGKLSTKDGSKNEFVDFCNGDVKGEDTETLNHFDEHTRYQFTRMLFAYGTGMTGQNPFANDEKVEITADIDSATHTSFLCEWAESVYGNYGYVISPIRDSNLWNRTAAI